MSFHIFLAHKDRRPFILSPFLLFALYTLLISNNFYIYNDAIDQKKECVRVKECDELGNCRLVRRCDGI